MPLVKMLVQTTFGGGPLFPGDSIDVEEKVAKRWFNNGIATPVVQEVQEKQEVQNEQEEEVFEVDYSKMTAKELYILCKGKNLEVLPKQSRKYYIEKLEAVSAIEDQQDQEIIEEENSEEQAAE